MAVEHAPEHRRGFYGAWPQVGAPAGLLLGTGDVRPAVGNADRRAVPRVGMAGSIPGKCAAHLRRHVDPAHCGRKPDLSEGTGREVDGTKMPVLDALKTYPREIALAAGSFVATHATFYNRSKSGLFPSRRPS